MKDKTQATSAAAPQKAQGATPAVDHTTHSVSAVRRQFKERGVFYTDSRLAALIRDELGQVGEVYDPTCGNGQLLAAFGDGVAKFGQEIDASQLEVARLRLSNFEGRCGDTLADPQFLDRRFEAIAANPPFSVKWEPRMDDRFAAAPCLAPKGRADYAFLLHCLFMLKPGGRAAVLSFPGVLYRGAAEGKIRQWLVSGGFVEKVVRIEGGYFEDTKIETALIVLRKPDGAAAPVAAAEASVLFADHERGVERRVPLAEVEASGWTLSVSTYLPTEVKREAIDPVATELAARRLLVRRLDHELGFSLFVARQEGLPYGPLLDELGALLSAWRLKARDAGVE